MPIRGVAAGLLAAVGLCLGAEAPVVRPDHAVISVTSTEDAEKLQRVFTDEMKLPAVWPVGKYGTHVCGGVFLGNFVLEIAAWPQVDPYQLLGVSLEARDTDAAYAELRGRGLRVKEQPGEEGYWSNAMVTEVAGEALGLFLTKYAAKWIGPLMEHAQKAFEEAQGGPFGVEGVVGIEVTMSAARRESLRKLAAPGQPESWDPPLVITEGPRYQIRSVKVKCKEPEKAKAILPAGLPVVFVK